MSKIKNTTVLIILLSFIAQINLFSLYVIAPPGSGDLISTEGIKTEKKSHIKEEDITKLETLNLGAITKTEIEAVIDDINNASNEVVFNDTMKDSIVGKLLSMGLERGRSFLVIGSGGSDYLFVCQKV